jgi:hypothetical protein
MSSKKRSKSSALGSLRLQICASSSLFRTREHFSIHFMIFGILFSIIGLDAWRLNDFGFFADRFLDFSSLLDRSESDKKQPKKQAPIESDNEDDVDEEIARPVEKISKNKLKRQLSARSDASLTKKSNKRKNDSDIEDGMDVSEEEEPKMPLPKAASKKAQTAPVNDDSDDDAPVAVSFSSGRSVAEQKRKQQEEAAKKYAETRGW